MTMVIFSQSAICNAASAIVLRFVKVQQFSAKNEDHIFAKLEILSQNFFCVKLIYIWCFSQTTFSKTISNFDAAARSIKD